MEEENSRSAASDDEDFEEDPNAEGGYDDEATLDEEEALDDDGEYSDELRELEEEGDLSVEELRRRYGLASDAAPSENVSSSATEVAPGTSTDAGSGSRGYFSDVDEEDENCDEDYIPADPYKKEVRVSEELYQAVIPSLDPLYESSFHTSLLWEPSICNDVSLLEAFLADTRNLRGLTVPPIPDDEDALFALINSQGNIEKALNSFPFPAANGPRLTVRADSQPWTTKEEDLFEEGLRIYEKNFPCIHRSQLPHRSIGELVEHYYFWKKTERYKAFVESRRRVAEDAVAAKAAARVETVDGPPVISEPPTNPSTDGDKQWKHKSEWTKGTKSWNAEEGKWNGAWKESSEALAHV